VVEMWQEIRVCMMTLSLELVLLGLWQGMDGARIPTIFHGSTFIRRRTSIWRGAGLERNTSLDPGVS